jgi:hypothetical protein
MLDISIAHFDEKISKMKPAAALDFCQQDLKIVEKLDGTKLTLIRTDEDLSEVDPLQGWIVSYKEDVIYPEEFSGLRSASDVRSKAVGRLWYNEVINHLKRAMSDSANRSFWQGEDVRDLEIFIEFIQRKGTLARQYEKVGGLYLTAIGKSQYSKAGGRVTSVVGAQIEDPVLFENVLTHLDLNSYPVLFEGNLSTLENVDGGIKSPEIRRMFEERKDSLKSAFSQRDWKGVLSIVDTMFKDFESELGGTAEGVVISVLPRKSFNPVTGELEVDSQQSDFTKKLFKTYSAGQSTKRKAGESDEEYRERIDREREVRQKAALVAGRGSEKEEQIFYDALTRFIRKKIAENNDLFVDESAERSIKKAMYYFSNLFFDLSFDELKQEIENEVTDSNEGLNIFGGRDEIKLKEVAISAARSLVGKFADAGRFKPGAKERTVIGILPMASKPVHLGHWNIINKAADECDVVYVIISGKPRTSDGITITGDQMGSIWMKILKKYLPSNVILSFSDSPIASTTSVIRKFAKDINYTFNVYAGEPDASRGEDIKLVAKAKEAASKEDATERVVPKTIGTMFIDSEVRNLPGFAKLESLPEFAAIEDGTRISGTLMRILIKHGIKDVFFALFPAVSTSEKDAIWRMLGGSGSISERLLRMHIRSCLISG